MSDSTTSPNMNLIIPTVATDSGPDWANNINSSLGAIDSHNHTSGQGVAIPVSGLNINTDLPMGNNSITQLKSTVYQAQASLATLKAVYVIGVDLYYNDGSGNVIRITQSGNVAGASGTITGLPSGTASASYQSVGGTFVFQSATNTPANISGATVKISEQVASPNFVSLKSVSSLAASYDFTFPAATPAAASFTQMSTAGALSASIPVSLGIDTANIANNAITTAKIADLNVTTAKLADVSVTTAKIADANVTGAKIESSVNLDGDPTAGGSPRYIARGASTKVNVLFGTVNINSFSSGGAGLTAGSHPSPGVLTITATDGGIICAVATSAESDTTRTVFNISNAASNAVIVKQFDAVSGSAVERMYNLMVVTSGN